MLITSTPARFKENVEKAALEPTDVGGVERIESFALDDEAARPLL